MISIYFKYFWPLTEWVIELMQVLLLKIQYYYYKTSNEFQLYYLCVAGELFNYFRALKIHWVENPSRTKSAFYHLNLICIAL